MWLINKEEHKALWGQEGIRLLTQGKTLILLCIFPGTELDLWVIMMGDRFWIMWKPH